MVIDRYLVMANLKDALEDALKDGLNYEDICKAVADTLNTYKKEQKSREQSRKN